MIALYVSALTNCKYCAYHHKVFLQVGTPRTAPLPESEQREEVQLRNRIAEALYRGDLDGAPVSRPELLLLRFVETLTLQPGEVLDAQTCFRITTAVNSAALKL